MSDGNGGNRNADMIARRNAIADSADEVRAEDLQDIPDDHRAAPPEPESEPPSDPDLPADPPADPPQKYTIKVNGVDEQLSIDELLARAQKVSAADAYLEQAKTAFQTNLQKRLEPPPSKDVVEPVETDWRATVRAIQMGTEDEAVEALKKLAHRPSEIPDVGRLVDEKLSVRSAAESFAKDYQDVLGHPQLREMFDLKEQSLLAAGDSRPSTERWKEIGDSLRQFVPKSETTDKLQRKASVASVPTAAGRRPEPVSDEEDDRPSIVIAQIAKARGQQRATNH